MFTGEIDLVSTIDIVCRTRDGKKIENIIELIEYCGINFFQEKTILEKSIKHLDLCIKNMRSVCFEDSIKFFTLNTKSKEGSYLLHFLVKNNEITLLKKLFEIYDKLVKNESTTLFNLGAALNLRDSHGVTPLEIAETQRDSSILEFLLSRKTIELSRNPIEIFVYLFKECSYDQAIQFLENDFENYSEFPAVRTREFNLLVDILNRLLLSCDNYKNFNLLFKKNS